MDKLTEEQLAKLPKWAQSHIDVLQKNLHNLEQERQVMFNSRKEWDTTQILLKNFHGVYPDPDADQGLSIYQEMRFYPDSEKMAWTDYIDVRIDTDHKCLFISGGDVLVVEPRASNSIQVYPKRLR